MCFPIRSSASVLVGTLVLASLAGCVIAGAGQEDAKPKAEPAAEIRVERVSIDATTLDHGASINPKLLVVIDDNAVGIAPEERDVYFRGLKLASETPLAKQKGAARQLQDHQRRSNPKYAQVSAKDFPQYVDLYQNPEAYRGRPVSLRGTIRRLSKYDPGKNALGIAEVYEGWFYTADSNSNPTVVVFTVKPGELSLGADFTDEIGVTGYFFKQYSYEAQGGPGKAPMLLAGTVEWHPGPRSYAFTALSPSVYVILTLALAVLGYGMWKANRPGHIEQLLPREEVNLAKLPPVDNHS